MTEEQRDAIINYLNTIEWEAIGIPDMPDVKITVCDLVPIDYGEDYFVLKGDINVDLIK